MSLVHAFVHKTQTFGSPVRCQWPARGELTHSAVVLAWSSWGSQGWAAQAVRWHCDQGTWCPVTGLPLLEERHQSLGCKQVQVCRCVPNRGKSRWG